MAKSYTDVSAVFDKFPTLYGNCVEGQQERYIQAFNKFKNLYGADHAYIASSSGRVEVLGNHTDHNGGKVVCMGISLDTLGFFLPNDNNQICIKSEGYPDVKFNLDDGKIADKGTSESLVRGVAAGLKNKGFKVGGFNAYFTGNVIGGAGISSSASYEVLIAEIFNALYNDGKIDQKTKAIVSKYAENEYFGKPCGMLDQAAIAFGGLKQLDFSIENDIIVKDIECDLSDYSFVLINTGGSHADLTDEYAAVPAEMKKIAAYFGKNRLIDVGEEDFYNRLSEIYNIGNDRAVLRAIHFFEENNRVDKLATALENSDYQTFIDMINKSGESSLNLLQNCYVYGGEQLITKALAVAMKYNADGGRRVHGGGFAGCTLNVVKNSDLEKFKLEFGKLFSKENVIVLSKRSVGTITL